MSKRTDNVLKPNTGYANMNENYENFNLSQLTYMINVFFWQAYMIKEILTSKIKDYICRQAVMKSSKAI